MAKYDIGELVAALNEAVNKLDNLRTKYKDSEKENARLLKVIAHIGEDHLESLSDAIAMALCRADGNDPYEVVSIKEEGKEPTFHLPYWQHYSSEAAKIARAALGEKE
jgi:hypothetical protein